MLMRRRGTYAESSTTTDPTAPTESAAPHGPYDVSCLAATSR
jgi:hypothetical protein